MNLPLQNNRKILLVDDIADNLRILSETLSDSNYKIYCAKNGVTALKAVTKIIPDLILLDIKMPDLNGYEVCQRLKADTKTKDIPVIFVSALDDIWDKVRAFEVGGVDYITKPFQPEEVLIRVKNHLALQSAREEVCQLNQVLEQKVKKRTIELEAMNEKLTQEISERQKIQKKLVHDALHDDLTGLPNRTLLTERIDFLLQHTKRNPDYLFAVLFIDLDRFKTINDSLGHFVGDQLLIAIAKLLPEFLRESDTLARLGGDEFIIVLDDIHDVRDAIQVSKRIKNRLSLPFTVEDQTIFTGTSIGIALSSTGYQNCSQILRDADIAMYRAKEKGKARYEVFDQAMYIETLKSLEIEHNLRLALKNKEFSLYYQPIIALKNNSLVGFEAFLRWQHPQQGLISPVDFIPIAEDTGLILSIGDWVLSEACHQLAKWQKQFATKLEVADLKINVNVASKQLQDPEFIQKLDQLLLKTGLNPSCLRLEITEGVLVDSEQNTNNTLVEIKKRQIKLSIDDFGTGYSSLSYLHRLPIDNLKIDRAFIESINTESENFEIIRTIIALAHTLGMDTVAEGVEILEQVTQLQALGCKYAQGYLFAKPLTPEAIELMLRSINKNAGIGCFAPQDY